MLSQKKFVLSLCAIASLTAFSCAEDKDSDSDVAGKACKTVLDCKDLLAYKCANVDSNAATNINMVCIPQNICSNGKLDANIEGAETDVDCGGLQCGSTCKVGQKCSLPADCASGLECKAGVCAVLSCEDDIACTKGDEKSDAKCDLQAKVCVSCSDGVKNGSETDTDCGGSCATACDSGQVCKENKDCKNLDCSNGKCSDVQVETADPDVIIVNEVFDYSKASSPDFSVSGTPQTSCEFIELANTSDKKVDLEGLKLNLSRTDKSGNVDIPLSGIVPAKSVVVVIGKCVVSPKLPEDAHLIASDKDLLVSTGTYSISIVSADKTNAQVKDLAIGSVTKSSYNRKKDFDATTEMKLSTDLEKTDCQNFRYFATPGYCANGGLYSQGCAMPQRECTNEEEEVTEYADPNDLMINEIFDSASASPSFNVSGTDQKACEFVEIANPSDHAVKLSGLSLEITRLDKSGNVTVPLKGELPSKHIAVVASKCDEQLIIPEDAHLIPTDKAMFVASGTYNLAINSPEKQNPQITELSLRSINNSSYNREEDFNKSAEMALTTDLKSQNCQNFRYFATPGYCANGGLYSNNCVMENIECGDGPIGEYADPNDLMINEVFDSGSKSPAFLVSGQSENACEFIEIANKTNDEIVLNGLVLVLDQLNADGSIKSTANYPLKGKLPGKNLLVVNTCEANAKSPLTFPDGVVDFPAVDSKGAKVKALITGTWTYRMSIKTSDDSAINTSIATLAIASKVDTSHNRIVDFDNTADMSLTTSLMTSDPGAFKFFATPGFCSNGGAYANNCVISTTVDPTE